MSGLLSAPRWNFVRQVASKELLSTLRDRRALMSSILLPLLLIPLFTVGFPLLLGRAFSGQQQEIQRVGIIIMDSVPKSLLDRLSQGHTDSFGRRESGVVLVPVTDPQAAVRDGIVDAVLVFPPNLPKRAGEPSATVKLYAKVGNLKAESGVIAKLNAALAGYNTTLVAEGLKARGVPASFLTPIRVQTLDASRPQEAASGQLAFLVPMFLLQFILAGGMATAIDSTAGEKERGTLEVLLVSPIRRSEVVVGKLLATCSTALLSAACGLVGLLLSGPVSRLLTPPAAGAVTTGLGGQLSVTPLSVLALITMALSAALLLSALLIAVSIFARSYKEAQTYVTPISLLIVFPAVGLQFADFIGRGAGLYAIPVVNAMVVILDVVKGTLNLPFAALAVAVNLLVTALLIGLAVRSFGREAVIFRN
ncbi:ABC transporter permease [Deinococcus radiomollis]|uniref:ABC transporter permease subunit n=1 Tax=Deinococcus radiomollis TaxID=468916 RepID=UPI0038914642